MGSFADAIALAAATGGPADIAAVRKYQSRSGVSLNLEQQITEQLGVFGRAGLANGNIEPMNSLTSTAPQLPDRRMIPSGRLFSGSQILRTAVPCVVPHGGFAPQRVPLTQFGTINLRLGFGPGSGIRCKGKGEWYRW